MDETNAKAKQDEYRRELQHAHAQITARKGAWEESPAKPVTFNSSAVPVVSKWEFWKQFKDRCKQIQVCDP